MATKGIEACHADRIQTQHHRRATELLHQIMTAFHLIKLASEIERIHHLFARSLGLAVDHGHGQRDAIIERAGGSICLQLIILDEVNAGLAKLRHDVCSVLGAESDRGFDDGADQRSLQHASKRARSRDTKCRAGIGLRKGGR